MNACLIGTSCCGITALLLLAGVACFAFVCNIFWVLKSRKILFLEAEREDRISQLPDDILCLIISRLSTIHAVRTSLISRRWRHVYAFITGVSFLCSRMPHHSCCHDNHEGRRFVRAVDTFLQNHSGSKIVSFELICCYRGRISDRFREWMNYVGNVGVEQLTIGYSCPYHVRDIKSHVFSSDLLPKSSSVKCLCLKGGFFQALNQNSLKDLELNDVVFTAEAIECILSNCSCLQSLKLKLCVLPSKLCIHGPHLRLKSLTVCYCTEVEEIDLSAINLINFALYDFQMVELSFTYVPLLQNLYIESQGDDSTSYVFEKVSNDLPHLKCMFFQNTASCFKFSKGFKICEVKILGNLRQLALFLKCYIKLDLLALATVLDVCPLPHKFHLSAHSTCNGKSTEKRVARCHTPLKEVEISGFNGTENEYNFILYILDNAVFLERLSISLHFKCYDLDLGCWRDTYSYPRFGERKRRIIRTWLQGKAISKNVEITIV